MKYNSPKNFASDALDGQVKEHALHKNNPHTTEKSRNSNGLMDQGSAFFRPLYNYILTNQAAFFEVKPGT